MSTVKIKRMDLMRLYQVLERNLSKQFPRKLAYAIVRTKSFWSDEVRVFSKFQAPSDAFQEYESKRMSLLNAYGKKGEDGSLITTPQGNAVVPPEKIDDFTKEMKELDIEFKEVIEERRKQIKEIGEMLYDTVSVPVYFISFDLIPEVVDAELMEVLSYMVAEDQDEESLSPSL